MMSPPMEYSFPSTSIILSEPINPAFDAVLFSTTVMIRNPNASFNPNTFAVSGSISLPEIPIHGCLYSPSSIKIGTIFATVCDGIANPTPVNSPVVDCIAVLIPTMFPLMFNNGPPEFPGLIAASV